MRNRTGVLLNVKFNGGVRYIRLHVCWYSPYYHAEYNTQQRNHDWNNIILYLHDKKVWVTVGSSGWTAYLDAEHKEDITCLLNKLHMVSQKGGGRTCRAKKHEK